MKQLRYCQKTVSRCSAQIVERLLKIVKTGAKRRKGRLLLEWVALTTASVSLMADSDE